MIILIRVDYTIKLIKYLSQKKISNSEHQTEDIADIEYRVIEASKFQMHSDQSAWEELDGHENK